MSNPFPIVIDSPADLWSGLDAILAYVEEHERDRLNGAIRRLANVRAVLFGPTPPVEPAHLSRDGEDKCATVSPEIVKETIVPPSEPPGKPEPAATADPAAPQGEPAEAEKVRATATRLQALKALAEKPLTVGQVATACGWSPHAASSVLKLCPGWFVRTDPDNRLAPYTLTGAGRRALEGPTKGATPAAPSATPAG